MAIFFKDFTKEAKDLLTKNYSDAGKWKIESKFKGPKDVVFVNPQASNDGVNVDLEYNFSQYPEKIKVNVGPKLDPKLTVTHEDKGIKAELTTNKDLEGDATVETKINDIALNGKFSRKVAEVGLSYRFRDFHVGTGGAYTYSTNQCKWSAGLRYASRWFTSAVITNQLQTYTTTALVPVTLANKDFVLGGVTECGKDRNCVGTVGVETGCMLFPRNAVRARVTNDLKWSVAYVSKFPDNWKAAVSIDQALKPGVIFTRE